MISMLIQFELTDPRSVPENGELYCKLLNSAHLSETRVLLRGPQLRGAKLSLSQSACERPEWLRNSTENRQV